MNNLVMNGLKKLPPGFRFQPTDEELVFQYLKCKVFAYPLPSSIIPDLKVCNFDPWELPGNTFNYLNHEMEKWVLCHVLLKKTSRKSSDEEEIMQSYCNNNNKVKKPRALVHKIKPKLFDFMRENDGITAQSSSSSSSRSDITEVSSCACSRQY
ncbi:hypothetical protein V6N13_146107 [Hibiscus sabdariffa]|uniref:NAC domain-containing protein n=1 Tax=Hibiscus sabdariffa TaxID=183260 RepID=A0ABR2TRM7_9ROSI